MHSIQLSGYRMGTKFDKHPLAVEQNNYLTKIVNVLIVYDLDAWSKNPTNNFNFKNWLYEQLVWEKIVIKKSGYIAAME